MDDGKQCEADKPEDDNGDYNAEESSGQLAAFLVTGHSSSLAGKHGLKAGSGDADEQLHTKQGYKDAVFGFGHAPMLAAGDNMDSGEKDAAENRG